MQTKRPGKDRTCMRTNAKILQPGCKKDTNYTNKIMKAVHTVIVQMIYENIRLRQIKIALANPFATKPEAPKQKNLLNLEYPQRRLARLQQVRPIPTGVHKHKNDQENLQSIRDFIADTRWELREAMDGGVLGWSSWRLSK